MQMPGGVPDYSQFMKMSPSQRKTTLKMLKFFTGKQIQPLLMVVYEKDPDAEVRQLAREMLESQGVSIRVEGDNLPTDVERDEQPDWMKSTSNPVQSAGIGIPVTDDLSRRAAEALKRGQGTPTPPPSSGGQSLSDAGATIYYTTEAGTFESPFSGPDTITGGEGRTMQRNQNFPSVFLLYPRNQKYLHGEAESPTVNTASTWVSLAVMMGMLGIFIAFSAFLSFDMPGGSSDFSAAMSDFGNAVMDGSMFAPFAFFFIIFGIIFVIVIVSNIRTANRMKRLAAEGKLLLGQASNVHGRWVTSGSGKSRSSSYKVSVTYRVRLPDGRVIQGSETATRSDLARRALPVPGTPVAVLYVSDEDKLLL